MKEVENLLTQADRIAIEHCDDEYINKKGAKLYTNQIYSKAVEYYRLAASMGNIGSISNLGYCYLYGRGINKDISLAISYFKIASNKKNPDAAYKLGDIYGRDEWGLKDKELSIYYYMLAVKYILGSDLEIFDDIYYRNNLQLFPSLCFALAREFSKNGSLVTNISLSYQFLLHAKLGYEKELLNGREFYRESYENVLKLIKESQYNEIREKYDNIFIDNEDLF